MPKCGFSLSMSARDALPDNVRPPRRQAETRPPSAARWTGVSVTSSAPKRFGQPVATSCADQRYDVRALRCHPGNCDLRRRRADLVARNRAELFNQRQIGVDIAGLKPGSSSRRKSCATIAIPRPNGR